MGRDALDAGRPGEASQRPANGVAGARVRWPSTSAAYVAGLALDAGGAEAEGQGELQPHRGQGLGFCEGTRTARCQDAICPWRSHNRYHIERRDP